MAKKLYEETDIQNIATQIRAMNGKATTYKTSQMPSAMQANVAEKDAQAALISQIATELQNKTSGGGITPTGTIDITENGEYDVKQYATANVALPEVFKYTGTNAQLVHSFSKTYTLADTSLL